MERTRRGPPGRFCTSLTSVCCGSRWCVWLDSEPRGVGLCLLHILYGAGRAAHAGQMTVTPSDAHGCAAGRASLGASSSVSGGRDAGGHPLRGAWTRLVPGVCRRGSLAPGGGQTRSPHLRLLLCLCEQRGSKAVSTVWPRTSPSRSRWRDPQPASEHGPREGRGSLKSCNLSLILCGSQSRSGLGESPLLGGGGWSLVELDPRRHSPGESPCSPGRAPLTARRTRGPPPTPGTHPRACLAEAVGVGAGSPHQTQVPPGA